MKSLVKFLTNHTQVKSPQSKLKLSLEFTEQEEMEFSRKAMTIVIDLTAEVGNQPCREP